MQKKSLKRVLWLMGKWHKVLKVPSCSNWRYCWRSFQDTSGPSMNILIKLDLFDRVGYGSILGRSHTSETKLLAV
jgi:hypothetical protein